MVTFSQWWSEVAARSEGCLEPSQWLPIYVSSWVHGDTCCWTLQDPAHVERPWGLQKNTGQWGRKSWGLVPLWYLLAVGPSNRTLLNFPRTFCADGALPLFTAPSPTPWTPWHMEDIHTCAPRLMHLSVFIYEMVILSPGPGQGRPSKHSACWVFTR